MKIKSNYRGFTLLEVIVTIAITLIAVMAAYNLFLVSQNAFVTGDSDLEITQNGRILLDRISRELRQTQQVVTVLPATKNIQDFPPPNNIEFQNGHDTTTIQYIKYYQTAKAVNRQIKVYYFTSDPSTYVAWNCLDSFGNSPEVNILEDRLVTEYVDDLKFYGNPAINIELWLTKAKQTAHFYTSIFSRNKIN